MGWTNEQAIEALEKAMSLEAQGESFYLQAAKRTQDDKGKVMFRSFAADETEHFAKLKRVRDELQASGQWLKREEVLTRAPARWQLPDLFDTSKLSKTVKPDTSDAEALRLAMEAERTGYQHYAASRDAIDDPDGKALFAFLAAEETGHYNLLESALAYLDDTASFFLISERAINEG